MEPKEVLPKSHGIYTIPEAARIILATHPLHEIGGAFQQDFQWRLLHWVDDGVIQYGRFDNGLPIRKKYTTFEGLISMRVVFELWTKGVSIGTISRAEKRLIDEMGVMWPLASQQIWRREAPAFPRLSALIAEAKHGPEAMSFLEGWLEEKAGEVGFRSGLAECWRVAKNVLIHGRIVTGRPCITGTRIPTWIIIGMMETGDSVKEIADWYDIPEERVKDAIAWEKRLDSVNIANL